MEPYSTDEEAEQLLEENRGYYQRIKRKVKNLFKKDKDVYK